MRARLLPAGPISTLEYIVFGQLQLGCPDMKTDDDWRKALITILATCILCIEIDPRAQDCEVQFKVLDDELEGIQIKSP